MAEITMTQQLEALVKEVYADKLMDLVPEGNKFLRSLPFKESERLGDVFVQPVMLANEHGFTYNSDGSAFDLSDAAPAIFRDAKVQGSEVLLRTAISYRDAAKNSKRGKKAFEAWSSLLVENLMKSMSKRLEIGHLYGRSGLGIVESKGPITTSGSNSFITIVLTQKSYATGIWSGMEGAKLDFFSTTASTSVKRNVTEITISAVDTTARSITLSAATADLSTSFSSIVAGDLPFFFCSKLTSGYVEWAGLDAIVNNTGTIFGISAAEFNLWKGNVIAGADAELSLSLILKSIAVAAGKGLDYDVKVMISPEQYEVLNSSDVAANRVYDESYSPSKAENGSKEITYYGQSGMVKIEPNIHIKSQDCFIVPLSGDKLKRVGATDVTFRLPGKENEELFKQIDNKAGFEMRLYTDQALFCDVIGQLVKINNIKNP